jgi:hypothetical protein
MEWHSMSNTNERPPETGSRSSVRGFILNLGLLAASLLLLEGLSFAIFEVSKLERYRPYIVNNPYHPYLGWIHAPNITINARNCGGPTSRLKTDAEGYSVTPHHSFKDPDIRIVITGGSTIFGVGSTTGASTVPSLVERMLVEEMNLKAEVHNIAVRGYQSFQEMLALLRFSTEHQFDLVVALSGRNDAYYGALEQNIQSALLPGNPHRTAQFVRRAEKGDVIVSGIVPFFRSCCHFFDLLAQVIAGDDAGVARTPGTKRSSELSPRLDDFSRLHRHAEITSLNFALMNEIARRNRARFVMILQPTLYSKAVEANEERQCSGADEDNPVGLRDYEQRFYRAYLDLEKPFTFYDASAALDHDAQEVAYYVDSAHYNDLGAELLARFVLSRIKPIVEKIATSRGARGGSIAKHRHEFEELGSVLRGEQLLSGAGANQ